MCLKIWRTKRWILGYLIDGDMGTLSTAKVSIRISQLLSRGLFSFNCGWYQPKMGMLINPHGDIEILIDLQKTGYKSYMYACLRLMVKNYGCQYLSNLSISISCDWETTSLMKSKITSSSTLIQQVHLWFAMNCLVTHEATQHLVDPSSV